ncbi:MAG: Asp-tRNA(Asn)/Glu-tRNA(Gln) amidotransferase subunit GatB [bacterium]|nr:Asp-tRNA(Asn)/Glu-tRNA(Gln) amidotransferase subunit GatB [bacterium]
MSNYLLTVGLEIHAELNTQTKMFCSSKNDPDEKRPNVNVCPVCIGYPGTLPVINKEAVRSVLRLGLAVGGEIADFTEFDRKNYFYPDIPKGYQISQYKHPLVRGGSLLGVALTRIHLEEDTAKSIHNDKGESLLDFNRAGVPLVELVTEPVIHDSEMAGRFAREFQLLITYLNIAHANMEKGEMRVEANISVLRSDLKENSQGQTLGTKVEIKNLNSFKAVEKAIRYEMERHIELLEKGEKVIQETRGWDEKRGETFLQRVKEESHDYRYLPDPDLPKLSLKDMPELSEAVLKETLPELPWQKRERYKKNFGLKDEDIEIYIQAPEWGRLFEETVELLGGFTAKLVTLASNYITSDLKTAIPAKSLAEVIRMVSAGKISSRGAKDILKILEMGGGEPQLIAKDKNLIQRSDTRELKTIAEKVIKDNPEAVVEYKKGKSASLQYLTGQAMKATEGSGNPQVLKNIFEELLNFKS